MYSMVRQCGGAVPKETRRWHCTPTKLLHPNTIVQSAFVRKHDGRRREVLSGAHIRLGAPGIQIQLTGFGNISRRPDEFATPQPQYTTALVSATGLATLHHTYAR
jgi:hypothetical protein